MQLMFFFTQNNSQLSCVVLEGHKPRLCVESVWRRVIYTSYILSITVVLYDEVVESLDMT